jgi:hypothetical protein
LKTTLLYRVVPYNGGVVVATEDRAHYIARLHNALRTSRTWAEFRAAVPKQEYSKILAILDDNGEPRPKGADNFDAEQVPGWSDGDYPPWLQKEMSQLLPRSLLEKVGTLQETAINGSYWHIPAERIPEMIQHLAELGFHVTEADALEFH